MKIRINLSINRAVQVLLLFLFFINAGQGLFEPILAVFVVKGLVGATFATAGFAAAIYAIVKSSLQLPIARAIDKKQNERDDFYVLLAGSILNVIYPLGLAIIQFPTQLYVLSFLNGVGGACLMAAYYAIFSHHVDKGSEGFEWSLFSVWGLTLSVALGAALGGLIADAIGIRQLFLISALVSAGAAFVLILLYPLVDGFRGKKTAVPIPPVVGK